MLHVDRSLIDLVSLFDLGTVVLLNSPVPRPPVPALKTINPEMEIGHVRTECTAAILLDDANRILSPLEPELYHNV